MFGSLRIDDSLLTQEDRASYRAHFCGTCHAMREFGGRACSLLTNYDETVLTVLVAGLERRDGSFERRSCTALPVKKVGVASIAPDHARFVAAATVAAVGAKLRDDVDDDRSLRARFTLRLLRSRERRAWRTLSECGLSPDVFRSLPRRQQRAELQVGATLAELAAPSADLLGATFARCAQICDRADAVESMRALGRGLGTFVYLWDAVEDLDEDKRRGRFNAIQRVFGDSEDLLAASGPHQAIHEQLESTLSRCDRALAELELSAFATRILEHLLTSLRHRVGHRMLAAHGRSAEAGDCDACACCEGASCFGESSGGCCVDGCCSSCDCCCCCFDQERRDRRRHKREMDGHR